MPRQTNNKPDNEAQETKRLLFDEKPIEVEEEITVTGDRVRYQLIWGASKTKQGLKLEDLSEKEKQDLERYKIICNLASAFYGKPINPNAKGSTKLVKRFIDKLMLYLHEKGEVKLTLK